MNFLSNRSYGRDILKVCLDHGTRKENGVSPVRILTDDHPILRSGDLNPLSYKKLLRSCVASVMHTIRINNVKNIFPALSNFNTVRFFAATEDLETSGNCISVVFPAVRIQEVTSWDDTKNCYYTCPYPTFTKSALPVSRSNEFNFAISCSSVL